MLIPRSRTSAKFRFPCPKIVLRAIYGLMARLRIEFSLKYVRHDTALHSGGFVHKHLISMCEIKCQGGYNSLAQGVKSTDRFVFTPLLLLLIYVKQYQQFCRRRYLVGCKQKKRNMPYFLHNGSLEKRVVTA